MDKISKISSYLMDEESRFIFQKRLEYNETYDFEAIKAIVDRYLPELKGKRYYPNKIKEMRYLLKDKKNILLFGSGSRGQEVASYLDLQGIKVLCFADNNSNKWGTRINGIEIKAPEDVDYSIVDAVIISPYEQVFVDAIHAQLINLGASCLFIDYKDYCLSILENKQYFDADIIRLHEDEVFVDAGVLNLETSMKFIEECKKKNIKNYKIYAFEPDALSYKRCKNILKNMPNVNIQLHNAGLWDTQAVLYFEGMGNGGSRITQRKTDMSINTVSLDQCISDKVTFIKMDIEGAEFRALKGCQEIIRRNKPKLAISIYHKKEDFIDIPLFVKELVPDYKLYIRHYSNDALETVLYAIM